MSKCEGRVENVEVRRSNYESKTRRLGIINAMVLLIDRLTFCFRFMIRPSHFDIRTLAHVNP